MHVESKREASCPTSPTLIPGVTKELSLKTLFVKMNGKQRSEEELKELNQIAFNNLNIVVTTLGEEGFGELVQMMRENNVFITAATIPLISEAPVTAQLKEAINAGRN